MCATQVWDSTSEDKLGSEADGDHQEPRNVHVRRRAASSGGEFHTDYACMYTFLFYFRFLIIKYIHHISKLH